MRAASRMLAENNEAVGDWVPCSSHKMQSCIKDAVNSSQGFILLFKRAEALNSILRTQNGSQLLADARTALGQKPLKVITYVETRWNSRCTMSQRLLEHRDAINEIPRVLARPGTDNVYKTFWRSNQGLLLSQVKTGVQLYKSPIRLTILTALNSLHDLG